MKENIININLDDLTDKPVLFRDLPEYDHNPFIESILSMHTRKKTVSITKSPQMIVNGEGEYVGDSYMVVRKNVDKEEFVKVFKDQLRIIFDLSKKSQKLLTFFIESLGINEDFIVFDRKRVKMYSGLSSDKSVYSALSELIQKSIIAKSTLTQIYYINPSILFNGDRLIVLNQWIKNDHIIPPTPKKLELKENWTPE